MSTAQTNNFGSRPIYLVSVILVPALFVSVLLFSTPSIGCSFSTPFGRLLSIQIPLKILLRLNDIKAHVRKYALF